MCNFSRIQLYFLFGVAFSTTPVYATTYNWSVPYLKQRDYANIGESACGPTSIAMLLKFYYPNSGIDMPEVYHSGTQAYRYNSGSAIGYKNVSWELKDPGLNIIDINYRKYYIGNSSGMILDNMKNYLKNIWNINSSTLDENGVYREIANGPLLGHVYGHGNTNWGHYVVIRGINDISTPTNRNDDTIYINDPYDNWNRSWDTSGNNKAINYKQFFVSGARYGGRWFRDALALMPNDTASQRQYSVVVDTGNNNFEGNAKVNSFNLDDPNKWLFYYGEGGDWYFPKKGEYTHAARWTPRILKSGYYQVSTKFRADSSSDYVQYNIHDKSGSIIATKMVKQYSTNSIFTYAIITDSVYLTSGSYVRATGVNQGTNVDAIKFKFLW